MRTAALTALAAIAAQSCGSSSDLRCGPGTTLDRGACVLAGDGCGSATMDTMGTCTPPGMALICGPGTHEEAGICLRDRPSDPAIGATPWSTNIRIGSPDVAGSEPAIAVDSTGRVFVAIGTGGTVEVWASYDAVEFDRVLSAPALDRNGFSSGFAFAPSIAVDAADRIVVAWSQLAYSSAGSGLWSAASSDGVHFESALLTSAGGRLPTLTLASTPEGTIAAAWIDRAGIIEAVTSTSSGTFGRATLIFGISTATDDPTPSIVGPVAFDRDHQPMALVDMRSPTMVSPSSIARLVALSPSLSGEPVFSATLGLTDRQRFEVRGAIASDANGRFRILYGNAISGRLGVFESRSEEGIHWTDPVRVFDERTMPGANAPSLAVDEQGGLHVLFSDTRSGGWLTYAAYAPAMGDFGAPTRVSDARALETIWDQPSNLKTAIAVRGGRRYAVWTDPRRGVYFSTALDP
jgi:hypothetical protein